MNKTKKRVLKLLGGLVIAGLLAVFWNDFNHGGQSLQFFFRLFNDGEYEQKAIDVLKVEEVNNAYLRIVFRPPITKFYWLAGALMEEKDDAIYLELVRCTGRDKCKVAIQSHIETKLNEDGIERWIEVLNVLNFGKPVILVFEDGQQQIWPPASTNNISN